MACNTLSAISCIAASAGFSLPTPPAMVAILSHGIESDVTVMVAPTGGKGQHASTWSVLRKRLAPLPQVMATSGKEEEEYGLKVSALRFLSDCNHLENIERQCTSLLTTSASEVSKD